MFHDVAYIEEYGNGIDRVLAEVKKHSLKSISQKIRQKIKPESSPNLKVIEINKKKIIEVRVKEGANKPYYIDSIAYKRVGSETPPIGCTCSSRAS